MKISRWLFAALLLTLCFSQTWAQGSDGKTEPMLEEHESSSLALPVPSADGSPSISAATRGNPNSVLSSIINIITGASTSQNSRAPQGGFNYERCIYLITAAEMAAAGFPLGNINAVGFNYSVGQDVPTTSDPFMVYLENTSDVTLTKTTDWAANISTMTLVHNDPVTIPAAAGTWDIPFVNGSSFTWTGGGVYVAFDYQNTGSVSSFNTAFCNTALANSLRNNQNNTGPSNTLTSLSAFRPWTRLGTPFTDIVQVPVVYALGKIPIPYGVPQVISAPVKNVSASEVTLDLTLTIKEAISGTVRFTNTQTGVTVAAGATQVVSFPSWSPTIAENDSIIITTSVIPEETVLGNNRAVMLQNVNTSRFAYSQGPTPTGGVGFTGGTGDFVAKFSSGTSAVIDSIQVNFTSNGNPYQLGIWDATGAGSTPGTNMFTSPSYTSATGIVTIPVEPPVVVNGLFYLGVRQTGTTNIGFAFQNENPIRAATFYYASPTGGTTWTDFAPNNMFRFMIEANIAAGFPMAYSSSTTAQNTNRIARGSTNQQIIGIQVVTTGNLLPLTATQFNLNTNGTNNTADISNAKIYYTGNTSVFSAVNQFGATVATPSGAYSVTGSQELSAGTNYFWLTYDIPSGATVGNMVDAECASFIVASVTQTPAPTAPAGARQISNPLSGTYTVGGVLEADYPTLWAAFNDISTFIVGGDITLNVVSDITETAMPSLSQWSESGAGGYTVTVRPSGGSRTISGNLTSALMQLNGADRVTIDGRIGGTGTNLTFLNTNTGGSAGVIWLRSPSASDSATNNTIRNCVVTGSSNTGTLIGISVSGAVGGVAPSAAINTIIRDNVISKAAYGVYVVGVDSNRMGTGNQVLNNIMGSSMTGDGFYVQGVFSVYQDGITISGNDIQNIVGATTSTNSMSGINLVECRNATVSANKVHFINYNGILTSKVYGIQQANTAYRTVSKPSNNIFVNNAVYDLASTATDALWNVSGINNNRGYGDKYYYNSVYLTGGMSGGTAIGGSAAFSNGNASTTTNADAIDVRNNIFQMNGSAPGAAKLYAHYTSRTSYTGSTLNHNILLASATGAATSVLARLGTTDYSSLPTWQSATGQEANSISADPKFVSATNLHIRTDLPTPVEGTATPISGILTDFDGDTRHASTPDIGADEGTFMPGVPMAYFSSTVTQNSAQIPRGLTNGQVIGIQVAMTGFFTPLSITQFDLNTNGTTNTADIANAKIFYTGTSSTFAAVNQFGSTVAAPSGSFSMIGTRELQEGTNYFWLTYDVPYTATVGNQVDGECTGIIVDGVGRIPAITAPAGTRQIVGALAAGDYTVGVSLFNRIAGTQLEHQRMTRKVLREVPVEENNLLATESKREGTMQEAISSAAPIATRMTEVEEEYSILMENGKPYDGAQFIPLSREDRQSYGVSENLEGVYTTITAALADLNLRGVLGHVRFLLTDATYPSETYPLVVNIVSPDLPSASATVTIKPAATVNTTVSGSSASSAIFRIRGTNFVTIDGSNTNGGTTRNMTIGNTSTTSPNVVQFMSVGLTPLRNSALKNCILINGVNTSTAVIASGSVSTADSCWFNGLTIQNNDIQRAYVGAYIRGSSVVRSGANLTLAGNTLTTSGANAIRYIGLYIQGTDTVLVSGNQIANFETATNEDDRGIWIAAGSRNVVVEKNSVYDLRYTGTGGYGPHAIVISTGTTNAGVTVVNNFVYGLRGDGWDINSTSDWMDNPFGILAFGTQSGVNIYYNSISLSGNFLNQTNAMSAGIVLGTGTNADVRNNIIANNLGLSGAVGYGAAGLFVQSSASQLTVCNHNDYWVNPSGSGVKALGRIGATASTTLAAWQAATGQDANSVSGDPRFMSSTNLHINVNMPSAANNAGTPIAGITQDIDGDLRHATTPDIGADEYLPNIVTVGAPISLGWSMNSNPVTRSGIGTETDSVKHLYPTPPAVNEYGFAFVAGSGYVQSFTMANRKGYWLKFLNGGTQNITGYGRPNDSIPVVLGWNLVGSISCTIDTVTITSVPPGLKLTHWFGYNNGYTADRFIVPGKGYWIKSAGPGHFLMNCATALIAKSEATIEPDAERFSSITITDADGKKQTLQFGADATNAIDVSQFEMPPTPPEGTFDARFQTEQGGFMMQTHGAVLSKSVEMPIDIQATAYPLTISWKIVGAKEGQTDYTYELSDGLGAAQTISGEGSMTIRNQAVSRFVLTAKSGQQLPTEFALNQNYPNPFNPTTSIQFALPVQSTVTMEIYNILGQRVRTLVNEVRPAGYHVAQWSGMNDGDQPVGSGVYFVRLTASGANAKSFTEVRKIMMMK